MGTQRNSEALAHSSELAPSMIEKELLGLLVNFAGAKVLEVGGGDGRLTKHFSTRSTNTVLIDPDISELTAAREELSANVPGNITVHSARAEHLPYPDESFDLVVFSWSL